MVDVFSEVDEELRREKLTRLWKKIGPFIIGGAVLFIAAMGFNVWWTDHVRDKRLEESEHYQEALNLVGGGSEDLAIDAFDEIIANSEYGYGLLARLQKASILARQAKVSEAVSEYDAIAADGSLEDRFRDFASLMAAMVLMDNGGGQDVALRLEPLAEFGRPWHHTASEQLGLWKFQNKEYDEARFIFQGLVADLETPQDLRRRAQEILLMVEAASPQNLLGGDVPLADTSDDVASEQDPEPEEQ